MPQASLATDVMAEMFAGVSVYCPVVGSSCTVIDEHVAMVGGVTSRTVTVVVHVRVFPAVSPTVTVTVLGPTLEQLKVLGDAERDAIVVQLSVAPVDIIDTSAGVSVYAPV